MAAAVTIPPARAALTHPGGIGRRGWGVLVLAVTVVVAITAPVALGIARHTVGQAIRQPITPIPHTGDCVLSAIEPAGSALQFMVGTIATASIGTCASHNDQPINAGEIVSITPDRRAFPRIGSTATESPDPRTCQAAAADYVEWPDRSWAPASTRNIVLMGPDAAQYLTGQQWLACAILPV